MLVNMLDLQLTVMLIPIPLRFLLVYLRSRLNRQHPKNSTS